MGCGGVIAAARLAGIQCYQGNLQHVRSQAERESAVRAVAARAAGARLALLAAGLPCGVVTGGGSGTFDLDAATGAFTEVCMRFLIFVGWGFLLAAGMGAADLPSFGVYDST